MIDKAKLKELYIENEYGIEYLDYYKVADSELVKSAKDNFNINTNCHNACINCQLAQIDQYPDSWTIRSSKSFVYKKTNLKEVIGSLRKGQRVKLVERKGQLAFITTTIHYGVCVRDSSHPRVYRERKSDFKHLRCETCESGYSARTSKIEGWLPFKHLINFAVKCSFIPKDYEEKIPNIVKASLSEEQKEDLLSIIDPTRWATHLLGVELRDHQKIDAMCTAKHTVRRWGRRSGKTFIECMKLLQYALTEQIYEGLDSSGNRVLRGPKILIASPYLAQITLIFDQINELIRRNRDIKVKRFVKTPFYYLEFESTDQCKGAVISGFTIGAQAGNEGGTVRGQNADLILLDEVDAMSNDDIVKVVQPIQATNANVMVMASSTPMGKQEWFWRTCVQSPHYKQTYFPSTVLDHWDDVKDEIAQEGLTDANFLQEYMAKFITQIEGVYQPQYIKEAEINYDYGQREPIFWNGSSLNIYGPSPQWIYSFGVDWNSNAGVEIVVVGLPPNEVEFWVVDAINIPKHEYQQHIAMEKIIELNRFWEPKFIYIDKGYGATQYEMLQIYSEQSRIKSPGSPDARMKDILVAYDFGKKIQYRNPASGVLEDTFAKPFLVENSIRQFEQGRVRFSKNDYMLHNQLHNYIIAGISPTGIPRYGMNDDKIGDHRLDALNLALVAYILEMSDWAVNTGGVTRVLQASGFGNNEHRIQRLISDGDKNWVEFLSNFPEGAGVPGRLHVRYEQGYIERKAAEKQQGAESGRTEKLDNYSRSRWESDMLKLGFSSDTEYKYDNKKKPSSRTAMIRSTKPKRRTF